VDSTNYIDLLEYIGVITNLPNTEQSSKVKGKTHKTTTDRISQQPENWENRNGPYLVQAFPKKTYTQGTSPGRIALK
jgi:hypothetical protein